VYVVVVVLFMVVVFIVKNARKVGLRIWCGKLPVKGPRLEATTLVPESIHALTSPLGKQFWKRFRNPAQLGITGNPLLAREINTGRNLRVDAVTT
jgi:hypothetical protein